MKFEVSRISLIGNRVRNEDYADLVQSEEGVVAVVADGLGGHSSGDMASREFTRSVMENAGSLLAAQLSTQEEAERYCNELFARGTAALTREATADGGVSDPHTTAAVAVVALNWLSIAHIGDSRVYRFGAGGVTWQTSDHSLVQMLVDEGEITEAEMGTHPGQGILHKSIRIDGTDQPSVTLQAPLAKGEALLLCSDGLWEHTEPSELPLLLQTQDLGKALGDIVGNAVERARGKSDNVTGLCIRRPG